MRSIRRFFSLLLLPICLLPFVFSPSVRTQVDVPPQPASEKPVESSPVFPSPNVISDAAALNLHRWGAVTIFHGLPSDRVNAIAEDVSETTGGSLWFGTDNGLVKYDGKNIEIVANESALPSRRILALKLDGRGSLWIGSESGAARLHLESFSNQLEPLAETAGRAITSIAASSTGEAALTTAQGEIIHYREPSAEEMTSEKNSPRRLKIVKLDPNSHPLLKFPNQPNETLTLASSSFNHSGELMIGSSGRGIMINRDVELREAVARPPRPYFVSSIAAQGENVWIGERASRQAGGLWLLKNGVMSKMPQISGPVAAVLNSEGNLWVGTVREGAYLFKIEGERVTQIEHLTFENTAGGLRSNQINVIFRDRDGIVWFGTDRGVCRYDRESFTATNVSENAQSNFVRTLLRNSSGEIFCGTNRGLFKLNPDQTFGSWGEIAEAQGRSVYALFEDNAGTIWAGANSGIFTKAKNTDSFTRVPGEPETTITITNEGHPEQSERPAGDSSNPQSAIPNPQSDIPQSAVLNPQSAIPNPQSKESVRAIAGFRGQIYAAIYDRGIEKIERSAEGFKRATILRDLNAQRVTCLANEGEAALWYGTGNGELWRFDGSRASPVELPIKPGDRAIQAIAIDKDRIWVGTSRGLLVRAGEKWSEYIKDVDVRALLKTSETPEMTGSQIRSESYGIVWCATRDAGLIKLRPDKNLSVRFDTEQGLGSQQVFALASNDQSNSEVWIGTSRGVVRHYPNPIPPRVKLKRLVADRIYLPEFLTAELMLEHTQRSFLLEVDGVGSRTYPSQFQYEFSLQDFLEYDWKKVNTHDPQFVAEGLRSRPYVVVARAISRDLVYSEPFKIRLRVRRTPFPWTTVLLTSLLGLAVIAAAWAFWQRRRLARANLTLAETNDELRETRLRLASETETERSRIARDLHDQTLADLRHLLVLTDQLPEPNSENQPPPPNPQAPSPILLRREIESISKEIRQICEDLSPSVLENIGFLPSLEWALSDAVAHLPAEEKFAYQFICEPNLEDRLQLSQIEQIQLYRIVQEALNNICRHAKAKQVKLSVRTDHEHDLVIEIEDDGCGFDGSTNNKTGHGVANIRSRANLIGAEVAWSRLNPGCRFEVRLGKRQD